MATNQEMLDAYIAAEQNVLAAKTYVIAGRTVTLEDLDWIQRGRREFQRKVDAENSTYGAGGGSSIATWNPNTPTFRRFGRNDRYR